MGYKLAASLGNTRSCQKRPQFSFLCSENNCSEMMRSALWRPLFMIYECRSAA
jgi:hypothetical protein